MIPHDAELEAFMPRDHHYYMGHRVLPACLFERGPDLLRALRDRPGYAALAGLWTEFGEHFPADQRVSAEGMTYEVRHAEEQGLVFLVFILPAPCRQTEAYFVAGVFPAESAGSASSTPVIRVFTLEHAGPSEEAGVLCEWTANGGHINYGPGALPGVSAFCEAVLRQLARS